MARENRFRTPVLSEQQLLDGVIVRLIAAEDTQERGRYRELMEKHHYPMPSSSSVSSAAPPLASTTNGDSVGKTSDNQPSKTSMTS